LSSAHCFGGGASPCTGPKRIALWIGDIELDVTSQVVAKDGGRSVRIEADLICNPAFDGKCSHGNDIALLKLHQSVPSWVTPVSLDLTGAAASKVGDIVTPMGFGLTEEAEENTRISRESSEYLRKVSVTVLAQVSEGCKRLYAGGYGCSDSASEAAAQNLDMQVCAGTVSGPDHDACAGDSGSPVVDASGVQVALVSYGGGPGETMTGPGRMCGDPDYPGVYARVSAFSDFIRRHVVDLPAAHGPLSLAENTYDIWRPISPHLRR
jgi:secreted trypsin-like serine protease